MVARNFSMLLCGLLVILPLGSAPQGKSTMKLISAAFKDGAHIPKKYAMKALGEDNTSPPLTWENPPQNTKSFALAMVDHHPFANSWVHWLVINIPAATTSLQEGASESQMPKGCEELVNSFGTVGYGGPQPPGGTGQHPYVITIYALNVESLDLPPETALKDFEAALSGKVLGEASITGFYER